jgi:Spy/CpxP family protein refolding chaperone
MKGKLNLKMGALCAILGALLLVPTLVQAKGEMEGHLKELKSKIIKELKLPPDKEKSFMEVDEKYAAEREKIIADLKKSQKELHEALAAAKPDEGRIKDLVSAVTSGQDKLFDSFKNQRNDEFALLTPVEQGKYLMAITNWRHQMMEKCMKEASGKKKK